HRLPGVNRYTAAMDVLATVQPARALNLQSTVARLRRRGSGGGALVLVTGHPDEGALAAFRTLARDFTRTVVMAVTDETPESLVSFQRAGAVTVVNGTVGPWGPTWRTAMELSWSTVSAG
ncbi:MAG: hypothetical protein ACE5KX_02240, partial [Acidimicrobiia bacterium]